MKKLRDLLRLKFGGASHREIGRALNISPGTVSYYVQAANLSGITWPLPETLDDDALIAKIEPVAKQLRATPKSKYDQPDWPLIHQSLARKHMTLKLLWEEYTVACQCKAYSYAQFSRHYKTWCGTQKLSMRLTHKPGDKAFIDFAGTTMPIHDKTTGNISFKAEIFVMALGVSHYTFVYACRSQTIPDWINAHVKAFEFFGGVPAILVPDNLKTGITDSCQFEPEANPTYADMAEYYNTMIIPARPLTPQDKSIAENAVLLASRWILARLRKQTFYSLKALNSAIAELLTTLNTKAFQKRQGSRYEQFNEIEKSTLKPLPTSPYELATFKHQTLPKDYHVRLDAHHYSVPYSLVNQKVLCRITQRTVEIFYKNKRVASHLRSFDKDMTTTDKAHMPKAHARYQNWTPESFLEWAQHTGMGVFNAAQWIVDNKKHPEICAKIHFGLKRLCKRFGKERLNQACRRALVMECLSFKSIRSILEKGLDHSPLFNVVNTDRPTEHDNVRGSTYYQQP